MHLKFKKYILSISFIFSILQSIAQSPLRYSVHNDIGWFCYFGDHKIGKKWGIHTEYQWRRNNYITTWQQSLPRIGVNYNLSDNAMLTLGYAYVQTFSYGELPIAKFEFPEHRIYQDLLLKNNTGRFEINHRLRLEERWLGNYFTNTERIEDSWRYVTRFRYRFRIAMPTKGNTIDDNEFYLHAYDEIFIQAGYNVGQNVFDQNRIHVGLGYKLNKACKFEAGFISQIAQKAGLHPDTKQTMFEYNNGFIAAIIYNLDFTGLCKPKEKTQLPDPVQLTPEQK